MNTFVFVVCGEDHYIDTLNFSLACLKRFTRSKILVITDASRNSTKINHDNILNIETEKKLSNHQASIFLKTSLHRILNEEENYCYLDGDVIALNEKVDQIFSHKTGPITFASDHNTIDGFSSAAMRCGCQEKFSLLQKLLQQHNPFSATANIHNPETRKLLCFIEETLNTPIKRLLYDLRFHANKLVHHKFHVGKGFYYNIRTRMWEDKEGNVLLNEVHNFKDKIELETNFHFLKKEYVWKDSSTQEHISSTCSHLHDAIQKKFGIKIGSKTWRHWNGGVFLFDKKSSEFMEAWHNKTMAIFDDPEWRVRDQGTLAATAWEFGLQEQKRIPEEYNFIADFYNPSIAFCKEKGFTKDNFKSTLEPRFIHIYHNFGNKEWDIWQGVEYVLNHNKF